MIEFLIYIAIGIAVLWGFHKGFIRQIGSLSALLSAILMCYLFGDVATELAASCMGFNASSSISQEQYWSAVLLGHIVLFVVVWLCVGLASRMLSKIVKAVSLGSIDGVFGAAFMTLKILIAISIILNLWSFIDSENNLIKSGGPATTFTAELGPTLLGIANEKL